MTLAEFSKHQGVRWGALIALLVGVSQFNTGLELVYSKWTADKKAEAAEKKAEEAKQTAEQVDDRFDRYIEQQEQAIKTQNKIAEAIQGYAAQQQMANQAAPRPSVWKTTDSFGREYCTDGTGDDWWPDRDGRCE